VLHEELEQALCRRLRVEAAVVMPSGSAANHAVLETFAGAGDVIISDQLNHGSVVDGCRLSRTAVRGTAAHTGIDPNRVITTTSFSKALGGFGGAVTGPALAVDAIRDDGRVGRLVLLDAGILAVPLGPPVTPADAARVRFVVTAGHAEADLTAAANSLQSLARFEGTFT
jgi:7-keto-8-aminopelargonate synthetase-like enzyme